MSDWKDKERIARRAIEDRGFFVHDANILFRENCPNIDLVVYGRASAIYVQVKSSSKASRGDRVVIGSPWSEETLAGVKAIYNRHDHLHASLIMILDLRQGGQIDFYLAPPKDLEQLARRAGKEWADKPKKNGAKRSIKFPKEPPRSQVAQYKDAWHQLGEPLKS